MPPADIMFSVRSPPSAGYLVMMSHTAGPHSLAPVKSFSQEAVAAGKVLYLHSRPGAWSDSFTLDVASGLGDPLEGIHMELEVLPAAIPLEGQNFSVPEGGARTLAPPLLRVTGPYFPTLPGLDLRALEPPRHGVLQREEQPTDRTLDTFSWREVWGAAYLPSQARWYPPVILGPGLGPHVGSAHSAPAHGFLSALLGGGLSSPFHLRKLKLRRSQAPSVARAGRMGAG